MVNTSIFFIYKGQIWKWQKQKPRLKKQHRKTGNVHNDFLYKHSTIISKNHAMVVMEDLLVRNMSRSASSAGRQSALAYCPGKKRIEEIHFGSGPVIISTATRLQPDRSWRHSASRATTVLQPDMRQPRLRGQRQKTLASSF